MAATEEASGRDQSRRGQIDNKGIVLQGLVGHCKDVSVNSERAENHWRVLSRGQT